MEESVTKIKSRLMKEYYRDFSRYAKGRKPERKVAWVTAFTPVEILGSLGIDHYYPESYAAVIAASGKEQIMLEKSEEVSLSRDHCSYSCCIEGSLELGQGPRGIPPRPDVLIATNNQCNTLPGWWNILAIRYNVPLIVIDYPGEEVDRKTAYDYVTAQHKQLISKMEALSGSKLDIDVLSRSISNSMASVSAWEKVIGHLPVYDIRARDLFDDISFLITSRCKAGTSGLYELMAKEMDGRPLANPGLLPVFWLGYPLWYHPERHLAGSLDGCRISGSNYITWWDLDYSGKDVFEQLFQAYNYTFLNLSQETKKERLEGLIKDSGAVCAVTLHNKSCKCDLVSAYGLRIPQVVLDIDMIDRTYLDHDKAREQMGLLKEMVCTI